MKNMLLLFIAGLALFGCAATPPGGNSTNITPGNNTTNVTPSVPPGYEVKEYCEKDSDCVRLNSCCDCGLGAYVNKYGQQPECPPDEPRCMCPIALSKGECQNKKCVAIASNGTGNPEPGTGNGGPGAGNVSGFCGWSTNGTCSDDADCISGGCSDQVCQSNSEEPVITTCEYRECYSAQAYGVACGCDSGKCRWQ